MFAYAADDADVPRGDALLGCVQACYDDFRRLLAEAHEPGHAAAGRARGSTSSS